ncbi:MAG: hypothetical protein H8D43_03340 [Chloroflexi bacterium]|nr:hypothetical protein [Chloroflexota bacterium]
MARIITALAYLGTVIAISACSKAAPSPAVEHTVGATLTVTVSESPKASPAAIPTKATVVGTAVRYSFDQYTKELGTTLRDFLVRTDQQLKIASQFDDPKQIASLCSIPFEDTSQVEYFFSIKPPQELESLHNFLLNLIRDWKAVVRAKAAFCANPSINTALGFANAASKYNQDLLDIAYLQNKILGNPETK